MPGSVSNLSIKTASVLLPLAHYFDLRFFEMICNDCIIRNLSKVNVCHTFDHIHKMDSPLIGQCLKLMCTYIRVLLDDGSLMRMQDSVLKALLDNDSFNESHIVIPREIELFDAMLKWADEQCAKSNVAPTAINRREKLKNRLLSVRFAAMTGEQFYKCLEKVGVGFFTDDEISATFLRIAMGPNYADTLIPKYFSYTGRIVRLEVKREETSFLADAYTGVETLFTRGSVKNWYIVGFESDAVECITNIMDQSRVHSLKYSAFRNRVMFTVPYFINKGPFVVLVSTHLDNKYVYETLSLDPHPNVFLNQGMLTVITAFFVQNIVA